MRYPITLKRSGASDRFDPDADPNAHGHERTVTDKSVRPMPLFPGSVDICGQP